MHYNKCLPHWGMTAGSRATMESPRAPSLPRLCLMLGERHEDSSQQTWRLYHTTTEMQEGKRLTVYTCRWKIVQGAHCTTIKWSCDGTAPHEVGLEDSNTAFQPVSTGAAP